MTGQLDLLATVTPTRPTAPATLLVLEALEDGPKCALYFTRVHGMGRFPSRMKELRDDYGWTIERLRGCTCGNHVHQHNAYYYRLVTT